MHTSFMRRILLIALSALASTAILAATFSYEYDALGRLTKVSHPDGSVENYTLDAAGNRVQFDTTGGAPSVPAAPASISGPSMSMTGNYTISWSASTGASRYELWESVFDGAFSKVYDGTGASKVFSNKPNGEYTYKAKACNGSGCSGFSPTRLVLVCQGGCNFFAPLPNE